MHALLDEMDLIAPEDLDSLETAPPFVSHEQVEMEIATLRAEQDADRTTALGLRVLDSRTLGLEECDVDGVFAADREDARRMDLHLQGYGDAEIDDITDL